MGERGYELHGVSIYECAREGEAIRDASSVLNAAFNHRARLIVLPVTRLGEDFFRLKTRVAGEMLGKLTTYKMRVAIVGDVSKYVAESEAFRDFVYETNRGDQIWFVKDHEELAAILKQRVERV